MQDEQRTQQGQEDGMHLERASDLVYMDLQERKTEERSIVNSPSLMEHKTKQGVCCTQRTYSDSKRCIAQVYAGDAAPMGNDHQQWSQLGWVVPWDP